MFEFALVNNRDSLKATMRVLVHSTRLLGRRKVLGTSIVEQQKRADICTKPLMREHRANGETVPHPVSLWLSVNPMNCLQNVQVFVFLPAVSYSQRPYGDTTPPASPLGRGLLTRMINRTVGRDSSV